MEWNEEVEKKLRRRGESWHVEKLASRLIFDGRRAVEHYTADEMRAKFEPLAKYHEQRLCVQRMKGRLLNDVTMS